jgi:hypothetical protein
LESFNKVVHKHTFKLNPFKPPTPFSIMNYLIKIKDGPLNLPYMETDPYPIHRKGILLNRHSESVCYLNIVPEVLVSVCFSVHDELAGGGDSRVQVFFGFSAIAWVGQLYLEQIQ